MGFTELRAQAKKAAPQGLAVAWAADPTVLKACQKALVEGLIGHVVLTGPEKVISEAAEEAGMDISAWTIKPAGILGSAYQAVELVRSGECAILMGKLNTADLLRAVLHMKGDCRAALLEHIASSSWLMAASPP